MEREFWVLVPYLGAHLVPWGYRGWFAPGSASGMGTWPWEAGIILNA